MGHPTLPGLLPLVALALMVGLYFHVASGMSIQKRHQENCPEGKYEHRTNASICCLKCHKGTYLNADCGDSGLAPDCKTCPNGTFTERENYVSKCLSCSICRKEMGQIEKTPCTISRNTVCGCGENQYQQSQGKEENGLFKCVPCNPCFNGTIQRPCQEKQDAVCLCNPDFFWNGDKCISCNECLPGEKCSPFCPSKSMDPGETVPVLMVLVIFLGFCCLSLIVTVFFCQYSRWKSKLYLIVCPRKAPEKEEEHGQSLAPSLKSDSTPISTQVPSYSPGTPCPGPSFQVHSSTPLRAPAPSLNSSFYSLPPNNWQPPINIQRTEWAPLPDPINCSAQMPSHSATSDDTALRLDHPAMLYTVVDQVPPQRWKEFIRRLGLSPNAIEFLEMQNSRCLREAHYSMLEAWQKGVPRHQATLETLALVLQEMKLCGCLQNIREALEQDSPCRPRTPFPR
ncbi:tumor necrosis factor receptor superfamily member 1A isoform X1 [Monodelphis domestica]|uniref:tumor necrosis factor receptor superfamily member 1A isoform X1 n=1 Tax=Monodelphis domestica TaxID=13616 RepID=UPI0024E2594C|nr:tumor necrosis factor receptor superfamily member 1A isoform X1 [Monodelphis domestica]